MVEKRIFSIDRRSGYDRRNEHNLDYFLNGGADRRKQRKRRSIIERRAKWCRLNEWYSVPQQSLENPIKILL